MTKLFLLAAALTLVGAGCTSNVQTQTEVESSADASSQVPAPRSDSGSSTPVAEPIDETLESVETETNAGISTQTPPQEQTPTEPETIFVTIVAKAWKFEPSTIRVKEGERVDLQIISIDVAHGFNLAAFGVSETLEPGKTVRTSFVADKKGSFPLFCDVFCGDGHGGMRGTLLVE